MPSSEEYSELCSVSSALMRVFVVFVLVKMDLKSFGVALMVVSAQHSQRVLPPLGLQAVFEARERVHPQISLQFCARLAYEPSSV